VNRVLWKNRGGRAAFLLGEGAMEGSEEMKGRMGFEG
jgi:hypothetical protein